MMRDELGEAYVATLRAAYPQLPETADFVMYWWHKAAEMVRRGSTLRFGFITTNSLRQTSSRQIVASHVRSAGGENPPTLSLRFAIPDHPWVDTADGAAVRIAMTVGTSHDGANVGELVRVIDERPAEGDEGEVDVTLQRAKGVISPDLSIGADVSSCRPLRSNQEIAFMGAKLVGDGFVVTPEQANALGQGSVPSLANYIKPFRNGRDLTEVPRGVLVIDFFGLSEQETRQRFPQAFQHLFTTVKPQRDQNKRASYRELWWIFAEPRAQFRKSAAGLSRYIATSEVSKHRFFVFVGGEVFPDGALIAIASSDAFVLGVLSSRIHVVYTLAAGGTLEDRPRYNKTLCFDPFPFPACSERQKQKIRDLAEELDAHRKRAQERHGLGLTTIYNVLEKLCANQPLSSKEQLIHDQALVSTLRHLHDVIDAAVADAYGWPWPLTDEDILTRVVALNAQRTVEETHGTIRWLRPEFQAPQQQAMALPASTSRHVPAKPAMKRSRAKPRWPDDRAAQVEAVFAALTTVGQPATAKDLAANFARADAKAIAEILSALVTLGRIHRGETRGTFSV
jgi:hypothetical protein